MFYFVLGFVSCFVLFCVVYAILRELIFHYGKQITNFAENEITRIVDKSIDKASIILPDTAKELFKENEDLKIDDLLNYE